MFRTEVRMFDADELFHLALQASTVGHSHAAISYLKELLRLEPNHASAMYLLGAQHAQIGLLERAIAEMAAALALEPSLEIARFQLGALLLDRNRPEEAKHQLTMLTTSADRALCSYSQALIALVDNDRTRAQEALAEGLAQGSGNSALSSLMQRLYDKLAAKGESTPGNAAAATDAVFLGAYRNASS